MRISRKLSLAFLLMSWGFLGVTSVVSYLIARETLSGEVVNHLQSVATIQHSRLENILDQNIQTIKLVSGKTLLRLSLREFIEDRGSEHREELNRNLRDTCSSVSNFREISVLTLDGTTVASTDPAEIGTNHSHEDFFVRGRTENCADIIVADKNRGWTACLSGPLHLDNDLIGVVAIRTDMSNIISVAADYSGLGQTGETAIAKRDGSGDALFLTPVRFDRGAALTRTVSRDNLRAPITQALLKNERIDTESVDYRGEPVLAATRYIEKAGWGVVVKIDRAEAFAPVVRLGRVLALLIFASTIVAIIASFYIAKTITRPVVKLTHLAGQIGRGDLSQRAEVTSADEVGALAQALNRMADGLVEARTALERKVNELNAEVTERKRAEEALRETNETNEYLENLFNYANAPIIVWDPQFRITRFNHAFESLTGRKAEDVTGGSLEVLFPPALVESSMALIRNTMGGERWETVEIAILHLDGSVRTVLWNSATIFATDGRTPVAEIAQGQDITERKQAEEELSKHRERLEQLVKDRTAQLEAAHADLLRKERLAALGQLVATVSHEIRNPLGTIGSSIFSVSERVRGRDEAVDRALDRAERNINRCDNIIEDLLSYSRNQPPNLMATDLDRWLAEVVDEAPMPEGIRLTKKLSCGVELPIDRERLRRGVINVIGNACEAMSGSKGSRALAPSDGERSLLTVETSVADGRVNIRVRDTGPGIPADLLEKVFEPLYSTKTFGVGLGLPIVKQIMEQHAGGVEVESREGEGALVTLWLPRGGTGGAT